MNPLGKNRDMETRTIYPYSSFTEDTQRTDKIITIARAETKASPKNSVSIKLNRHTNANNIMEIRDSFLARKDNIVIFIIQDGQSYDDDS